MPELTWIGALMFLVALALGAVDGLYFHLWKLRLHARPASRREHVAHTLRALLLPPTLALALVVDRSPAALYAFLLVETLDLAVVVWDVWMEPESRRDLGGLSRGGYLIHAVAGIFHTAAVVVLALSWPLDAWQGAGPVSSSDPRAAALGALLVVAAVPLAALHVALLHPRLAALTA